MSLEFSKTNVCMEKISVWKLYRIKQIHLKYSQSLRFHNDGFPVILFLNLSPFLFLSNQLFLSLVP